MLRLRLSSGDSVRLLSSAKVWSAQVFRRGAYFEVVGDGFPPQVVGAKNPVNLSVLMRDGESRAELRFRVESRKSPPMLSVFVEAERRVKIEALRPRRRRGEIK